jgi:hypothetical protein
MRSKVDAGRITSSAPAPTRIVRWHAEDKAPPGIVLGGQWLYRKSDVARWLDRQHQEQTKAKQPPRKGRSRR